jgi:peptide chain release factor subunit 3
LARKMISNPDSLVNYPEVSAVLEADWEHQDEQQREDENLLTDNMSKMDLKEKEQEEVVAAPLPHAVQEEQGTAVEEPAAPLTEGDPREHIHIVFIGHVDAGKSTLSGNILYLTDNVDKRTIERYEREAKELNRESWFLAFVMDTNEEERAKGITVEVGRANFETQKKRYTILDAPGHKNYVPNMIMGASQADVGILVISARRGEFETGFERGGQTREHAMLAKTLGVSYLIVVINKMDDRTVGWDKKRFDECVNKLRPFLKGCGYKIKKEVKFLPISGLQGHNVMVEVDTKICPWWKQCYSSAENNTTAPTLFSLLDSLEMTERDPTAPVRVPVLDRYHDRGTIVMGKVESGTIRPGLKVTMMPTRNTYKIDGVWVKDQPVAAARPGENVLIKIGGGCGLEDAQKGYVICSTPPCRAVKKMICDIALLDMPDNTRIFTAGFQCMWHAHTCEEEATIVKLFETTNSKGVLMKEPTFASVGMRVKCMIEVHRTVPVETYHDAPFLGRFTLRTEGKTIAIGKIVKLPPKKE